MKNYLSALLLIVFLATGCSTVGHMDELLRLQNYSKDKDRQEASVKGQNKNFEKLLKVVRSGGLNQYRNKKSILKEFGKPVIIQFVEMDDIVSEVWLYRYTTKFFGSDKVYIYFDKAGQFQKYDFVPAPAVPIKTVTKPSLTNSKQ